MLNKNFLESFPFPFLIQHKETGELISTSKNSFFDPSGKNEFHHAELLKNLQEGWSTDAENYSIYIKLIPNSDFLIKFHSLKIKGIWKSQKKLTPEKTTIITTQERFKSYADDFLRNYAKQSLELDLKISSKIKLLVTEQFHEIRSMNGNMYHAAYELADLLKYDGKLKLDLAKNVVALSELISSRISLADLASSGDGKLFNSIKMNKGSKKVLVFPKFEKIVRCYNALAKKRDVTILMIGESRSSTKEISNFEMIPLTVIDNAVKYSPNKEKILIEFSESSDKILCSVKSKGPKLNSHELNLIFKKEYRGTEAKAGGYKGGGIGLFFCKNLLDEINGTIDVYQDGTEFRVGGKVFYETKFSIEFTKN